LNGDEVDYLGLGGLIGSNLFSYCHNGITYQLDISGKYSFTISDFKSDWAGREILKQYLYGKGKERKYTSKKWANYMMKAKMCWCCNYDQKLTLKSYIENYVKNFILKRKNTIIRHTCKNYNVTIKASLANGESIYGYNYLHGTNGGLNLNIGAVYMAKAGNKNIKAFWVIVKCTWNDRIDPNYQYTSDSYKAGLAQKIPFANPKDYDIKIIWTQYMKVYIR
jgi:hypothetical protein